MGKIKVLVVDDSLLFREVVTRGIEQDPLLEVVASAADPFEARDKILKFHPDVMTLDVEMPKMDGIEFLKRLLPQYPLPVVVVSAVNEKVFEALKYGAVDVVTKPQASGEKVEAFLGELIVKLKIAASAKVKAASGDIKAAQKRIIAIGSSTGGTEAVHFSCAAYAPRLYQALCGALGQRLRCGGSGGQKWGRALSGIGFDCTRQLSPAGQERRQGRISCRMLSGRESQWSLSFGGRAVQFGGRAFRRQGAGRDPHRHGLRRRQRITCHERERRQDYRPGRTVVRGLRDAKSRFQSRSCGETSEPGGDPAADFRLAAWIKSLALASTPSPTMQLTF